MDQISTSGTEETLVIKTVDMHTAGEALRIITSGYPPLLGGSLLEKRDYALQHLERFRRLLMFEPRGHYDMYGAILTTPDDPEQADVAVLFIQNEGYSTMCGHAVIALGRYLVDTGLVDRTPPETMVRIQCPCGVVKAYVECDQKITGNVRFHSVQAYAFLKDVKVEVPEFDEPVLIDVAFGGAFYAILPSKRLGLEIVTSSVNDLVEAASAVTEAAKKQIRLCHPDSPKLAFLYGTILTDGLDEYSDPPTTNLCVFAKKEVDRSPTGSGVTARMALQHSRGQIAKNQERVFHSILGERSRMKGRVVSEGHLPDSDHPCVTVEVSGKAHYMGRHEFILEEDDPYQEGFLLY